MPLTKNFLDFSDKGGRSPSEEKIPGMRKHYKKEKILARLENTTEWENTILRRKY
jgi:hypothetical protein